MPRTKKVSAAIPADVKPKYAKPSASEINVFLKSMEQELAMRDLRIQSELQRIEMNLVKTLKEMSLQFPYKVTLTMAELKTQKQDQSTLYETASLKNSTISTNSTMNSTRRSSRKWNKKTISSLIPTSQSIKKVKNTPGVLSRSKLQNAVRATMNSHITPMHRQPPTTFGTVTPKMKPNTPQVLLRHPRQGETAISMQGSPLMVGSVISDVQPNVNIPLQDGRILSIQPQRGLCSSDIPVLDPETKRQIEILRDNLNKVCALVSRH